MRDYQKIYNEVVQQDQRYNAAENSPGFRYVVQATDQLSAVAGRSLDVGCGVGFVMQYLSGAAFSLQPFGLDVSDVSVERTKERILPRVPQADERVVQGVAMSLPYEDDHFSLVTCFDVLEHLDEIDVLKALNEISRVVRPGGLFYGSVSCRKSGITDINGDNLHLTVRSPDWWIEKMDPNKAVYDGFRKQLAIWKRRPFGGEQPLFQC